MQPLTSPQGANNMVRRLANVTLVAVTLVTLALALSQAPAHAQIQKNEVTLPSFNTQAPTSPSTFANYFFVAGLAVGGILAFAMIVIGGIEYAISGGNSSRQSDAMDRIREAIAGLLLLLFSYLILKTINPNLVILQNPIVQPPPPPPRVSNPPIASTYYCQSQWTKTCDPYIKPPQDQGECTAFCAQRAGMLCVTADRCTNISQCTPDNIRTLGNDLQAIAKVCNELYPAGDAPTTDILIQDVKVGFKAITKQSYQGSIYTYDNNHPSCNYSRGYPTQQDSSCDHVVNSCHYGGSASNPNGSFGAFAIDWGLGQYTTSAAKITAANALAAAGRQHGLMKAAVCENGSRQTDCGSADHVHMAVVGCDQTF